MMDIRVGGENSKRKITKVESCNILNHFYDPVSTFSFAYGLIILFISTKFGGCYDDKLMIVSILVY